MRTPRNPLFNFDVPIECLYPQCKENGIKAHSISSQFLKRVSDKSRKFVYTPAIQYNSYTDGPYIMTKKLIKKVSIFRGLCNKHDGIYQPVDSRTDSYDPQYMFLLSHRAVMYEAYLKERIKIGLDKMVFPMGVPSEFIPYIRHQRIAVDTLLQYKKRLDQLFEEHSWHTLKHIPPYTISNPTIAASGVISLDDIDYQNDQTAICTVLPISKREGCVFFSSTDEDFSALQEYLSRNLYGEGEYKFQLSKLVLRDFSNFAVSPIFWESLSQSRQGKIVDFLNDRSSRQPIRDNQDKDLCLFNK